MILLKYCIHTISLKEHHNYKDIVPIFNSLANIDIKENINFSVSDKLLKIEFITDVAEYCIYVPSCDKKGKRIDSNFIAYGA